jgi:hypothetical protein
MDVGAPDAHAALERCLCGLFTASCSLRAGMPDKTFDKIEAYDTKGNRWLKFASLPTPRHGFAAADVPIGSTFVF